MIRLLLLFALSSTILAQTINGVPSQTLTAPSSLIGYQIIMATGSGTYTPSAGTNSVIIQMVGAGGGGSGVASAAASQVNLGGGGSGGCYLQVRLTSNFSGASYSVGAGGTAGASGNNNGGAGGNTTFTAGATTYTAGGGAAGQFRGSFAPPINAPAIAGGTCTNGDINIPGGPSLTGLSLNTFISWSGQGGSSFLGQGAVASTAGNAASAVGVAPGGFGAGASGAMSSNAGGAAAGAAGSNGIIIIYEYR